MEVTIKSFFERYSQDAFHKKINSTQIKAELTMQQVIHFFKHSKHASALFFLAASNLLFDVIMLSGTIKVKNGEKSSKQ